MKVNIMNHTFSPFLAENQRPMSFQNDAQMARGINMAINDRRLCGRISKGAIYNTSTPHEESVTDSDL